MKQFTFQKEKGDFLNAFLRRGKKKNLNIILSGDKFEISLQREKFLEGEGAIPVSFRGKVSEERGATVLKGKFTYGLYLDTLVAVAILLIAARLVWSILNGQTDNIILCGIVTVVLLFVMGYVHEKAKAAKKIILDFFNDTF